MRERENISRSHSFELSLREVSGCAFSLSNSYSNIHIFSCILLQFIGIFQIYSKDSAHFIGTIMLLYFHS